MKYIIFGCFLSAITLMACGGGSSTSNSQADSSSVKAKVTFSAGQSLPMDSNRGFLSLPFNIAADVRTAKQPMVIISDDLKVSSKIDVIPIGVIRIDDEGRKIDYIISIPSDENKRTIPTDNFYEFTTVYSGAKWIIEQYFINYKGLGRVKLISWEDEKYAKRLLNTVEE